jgi:hypothetical protein
VTDNIDAMAVQKSVTRRIAGIQGAVHFGRTRTSSCSRAISSTHNRSDGWSQVLSHVDLNCPRSRHVLLGQVVHRLRSAQAWRSRSSAPAPVDAQPHRAGGLVIVLTSSGPMCAAAARIARIVALFNSSQSWRRTPCRTGIVILGLHCFAFSVLT